MSFARDDPDAAREQKDHESALPKNTASMCANPLHKTATVRKKLHFPNGLETIIVKISTVYLFGPNFASSSAKRFGAHNIVSRRIP
jgi:hypothetical protein